MSETYLDRLNENWTKPRIANTLNGIAELCYLRSLSAGWWTSMGTEDKVTVIASKLALIHSEISEALEGVRKDLQDDHLPNRKMVEVELADAVIRIFDLSGAMGLDIGGALAEKLEYNLQRDDHRVEARMAAGGKKL
jgi:NTP pyrophosphatase (non-canonical NTP hydrolase)